MTLGQMTALLRRRLQEKVADDWLDTDLYELLNLGLRRTQLAIKRVHPDAALNRAFTSLAANVDLYDVPPGFVSEYLVELLNAEGQYKKIRRINFNETVDRPTGEETRYTRTAKWIKISPTPTAAAANGLRIWFVPTLTMSDPSDIPDIPLVLHEGPIIWANKIALGETGEASKDLREDWIEFIALILDTYNVTDGDPQHISLDLDKTVF